MLRPRGSQRGYHQHLGPGRSVQQLWQRLDPAHPGHFEVEKDHIDPMGFELVETVLGSAGCRDDGHVAFTLDHAREDSAHGQRIVDQHHADQTRRCVLIAWRYAFSFEGSHHDPAPFRIRPCLLAGA